MPKFKIACDVQKDFNFIHAITTRQGEKGNTIEFQLFNGGLAWDVSPTGRTFKLKVETPFGHYIEQTTGFTVVTNKVTVAMIDELTNEIGQYRRFFLEVTDPVGNKFTTPDVKYYVIPDATITGGGANDYIDRIEKIIEEIQKQYDEYIAKLDSKYLEYILKLENQFQATKAELEKQLNDFETKLTNDYNELWTKFQNAQKAINETLADLNASATAFEKRIADMENEVSDLQRMMDELVAKGAMTKEEADGFYMGIKGAITTEDINSVVGIGTYELVNASGANRPNDKTNGTLLVLGEAQDNGLTQLFIDSDNIVFRKLVNSTWSAWKQVGGQVNDNAYLRVFEDTLTNETPFKSFFKLGLYPVLLMADSALPDDSPITASDFETLATGWLDITRILPTTSTVDLVQQKVFFPTLGKAFMRIQTNSVDEGNESQMEFSPWSTLGGAEFATVEEVIIGEVDDKVISPAVLKEATESTVPYIGYFNFGTPVENISATYPSIPIGELVGTSPNGAQKQPFTVNGDGTLTLTRACKMRVEATMKFVSGNTTPSLYAYFEMRVGTSVNRLGAIGSTKAQNGSLNYDWNLSSDIVISGNAGDVIRVACSLPSNMVARLIQLTALTLTEIPDPKTQGLNISALADNPVIRLEDLEAYQEAKLVERGGYQVVSGENRQLNDPSPNVGLFGISDNNKYSNTKEAEPYFTVDSNGVATVKKAGTYKITGVMKRQFRTSTTLWHYVSLVINTTQWDFLPFGGTTQNRNRTYGQIVVSVQVGDTIQPKSESNNTTAGGSGSPLQFLNFDQFGMERLGD